ncbi:hypothetical protein J2S31_002692 [Nitrospina gracilis Nb-211]|nr:hypothetical protein [Nitrospina gracilis Nb-211]
MMEIPSTKKFNTIDPTRTKKSLSSMMSITPQKAHQNGRWIKDLSLQSTILDFLMSGVMEGINSLLGKGKMK